MGGRHVEVQHDESSASSDVAARALSRIREPQTGGGSASPGTLRASFADTVRLWVERPDTRLVIAGVSLVLAALVVALVVVGRQTSSSGVASGSTTQSATVVTTTTTAPGLVIDVGGAVRTPGVYRVAIGSRVVDALEAAGGPAEDIDLDHVNLASPVEDGQRVWLVRRGEAAAGSGAAFVGTPSSSTDLVDLNRATLEQLDALPGIGPATAKAILERRVTLGRFRSVDDLLTVKGIGQSKLDAIRSSLVVR